MKALRTGASLAAYLDDIVKEGVKSALSRRALQEKEKQAAAGGQRDNDIDLFSDDGGESPSKTMDDESEKLKHGDIEPKDIVDKLNSIRSGKSFKDEQVSAAMDEYVGSLSKAERVALLAFLKGIAQIVTGEVSGTHAIEPESNPANVEMEKGQKQRSKHVQPNVIKASPPKEKPKAGTEDASGPTPITPKKR